MADRRAEAPDGRLLSRSSVDKSVIKENPSGSFVEEIKIGELAP